MFGNPGWYVTTNGVLVLFLFVDSAANPESKTVIKGRIVDSSYIIDKEK